MKKYFILLMLGFITSFGVYASGIEKKESVKLITKTDSNLSYKLQSKLYTEFCFEILVFIGECPDGSEFIGAYGCILSDCDSGEIYGIGVELISSSEESC